MIDLKKPLNEQLVGPPLRPKEFARAVNMPLSTVYNQIENGLIEHCPRPGPRYAIRIPRRALEAYI